MLKRKTINAIAIIAFAALFIFSFFTSIPSWSYLILAFIWFLITLFGSFFIQWNYHITSLHANPNNKKQTVAITFDDGPHPEFTQKVLALLKKHDAKATFFCIGKQVEKHPEILNQIITEGHTVGNHTFSHSKSFGFFSTNQVVIELNKNNQLIERLTGKKMKLYRPAFAVTNPMIERAVKLLKVKSIGWSVRSLDTTLRTEKQIIKRITTNLSKGDVILLHDTSPKTVNVLEQLLLFLKTKDLKSVSVDQLLEIEAYE